MSKNLRGSIWFIDPKDVGAAGSGPLYGCGGNGRIGQMYLAGGMYCGNRTVRLNELQKAPRRAFSATAISETCCMAIRSELLIRRSMPPLETAVM